MAKRLTITVIDTQNGVPLSGVQVAILTEGVDLLTGEPTLTPALTFSNAALLIPDSNPKATGADGVAIVFTSDAPSLVSCAGPPTPWEMAVQEQDA